MSGIELLLSDARGVYIPQNFCKDYLSFKNWGLKKADYKALNNPDNGGYWDAWESVLNNAKHTDKKGNVWYLWQDGDLWAICHELMTDEEKQNFGFEG